MQLKETWRGVHISIRKQHEVLTMTGFVTILRTVPTLTLRHSRMMLSHLLDMNLGFFVLGENCSGGWFPNWEHKNKHKKKSPQSGPPGSGPIPSLTWSFIRALRGNVIFMLTSSKNSVFSSSCCCSPALFTAASTRPPEGAGEEWAESAGRGETLSSLLTLPVLALSASSSSSSLDRTTGEETEQRRTRTSTCCFFSN